MSYLKVFSVVLLCAFITSCGDEQVNKDTPAENAPKTEIIINNPPPAPTPPPAPAPEPEPKTEVEVKMNTPMGDVKVNTGK